MKSLIAKLNLLTGVFLVLMLTGINRVCAQTYTLNNDQSVTTIFGTSNIHDWEIDIEQHKGSLTLEEGATPTLTAMEISIPVTSLKSGKSGMDKNTYKAMNAEKYPTVTFKLGKATALTDTGNGTYQAKVTGELTISGVTKPTDLTFTLKKSGSKLELNGEKSIDMTAYNVEPPTALMGTITTGKDVTLKFKTILTQ
jgi:polyisoprenoid-binding protein YceI